MATAAALTNNAPRLAPDPRHEPRLTADERELLATYREWRDRNRKPGRSLWVIVRMSLGAEPDSRPVAHGQAGEGSGW